MVAFQKPITYQGRVMVKSTSSTMSMVPIPPGESATAASQISPAMVRATAAKNRIGRQGRAMAGAAISSREERSSIVGAWMSFRAF